MERVSKGIRLVVRNATPELRKVLDGLNVLPVCDESNCRAIVCATPAELDAVREPLKPMFDARGNWIAR